MPVMLLARADGQSHALLLSGAVPYSNLEAAANRALAAEGMGAR
jgi:hypothetical protein